ncbi:hypothetical protein EJ110_NYTH19365 [Nymphaea thermarum]|nr:hypothetical protein EJ110_NYTH19365 [Nymphaea thermarum]
MQQQSEEVLQRIPRISGHFGRSSLQGKEGWNSLRGKEPRAKGEAPGFKVAILGAAGGIGQPLSMLLKMNPLVSLLHLYDVANSPGVTADISHMDTSTVVLTLSLCLSLSLSPVGLFVEQLYVYENLFQVRGFLGEDELKDALTGMDLVIIPASFHTKPLMSRDDLLNTNAGIIRTLIQGVNLISNPVNSIVPIAAEVLKKANAYDPKRLLGVTTLDVVRANTFVAEFLGIDPKNEDVPVVGGHAGVTILPLLSQVKPPFSFTLEEIQYLTNRIQNGGTEVVEAKARAAAATLSMAYAAAKFADACMRALRGDAGIVECAFVASGVTELPFFASKVRLGRSGIEEIYPLGPLNEFERAGLEKAKKELAISIEKGISFPLSEFTI